MGAVGVDDLRERSMSSESYFDEPSFRSSQRRSGRPARRHRDVAPVAAADRRYGALTQTPRERQVLDAVAQGLENKEIAHNLGISEQRAKELVSTLLRKLGVGSRAALARIAVNSWIVGSITHADVPYSYLFAAAPILIAVTEGPQHRIVLVNSEYVQTFGDRNYLGRTVRACFPELSDAVMESLDRTYRLGERYGGSELPRVYHLPSGERRAILLSLICEPMRSPAHEITGTIFYGCDVTDLVARRQPRASLTADQRSVLDQLPVAIVCVDAEGQTTYSNDAAGLVIGRHPNTNTHALPRLHVLTTGGAPFAEDEGPLAAARHGRGFDGSALIRRADGTSQQVHVQARPDIGDRAGGVMIVLRPLAT
jgi:DNA-binding CsgD family transcriptional regulator